MDGVQAGKGCGSLPSGFFFSLSDIWINCEVCVLDRNVMIKLCALSVGGRVAYDSGSSDSVLSNP